MTAAALAAGIISSQAQGTVYSQNVVGYVNLSVPAAGSVMIANQLDTGSNTLDNVFQGTGLVSLKTTILQWTGTGYNTYTYENCSDSGGDQGWYNTAGAEIGQTTYLQPGQGVFMHNGSGSAITVPTVGQVTQGTNLYTIASGTYIYSLPEPLAGTSLDSTNVNLPAVSLKTTYLAWTGTGYNTLTYENCSDSGGDPGWYSTAGVNEDSTAAAWPNAGTSFFIHSPSAVTWTNVFEVQ